MLSKPVTLNGNPATLKLVAFNTGGEAEVQIECEDGCTDDLVQVPDDVSVGAWFEALCVEDLPCKQPQPESKKSWRQRIMDLEKQVAALLARDARLEEAERKLTAAQAELAKRELTDSMVEDEAEPIPDEPPAGIADLFHPDRPYAEQAQALWEKYKELTNKLQMGLATPEEIKKQSRLQGDLDWIKHHAFEGV